MAEITLVSPVQSTPAAPEVGKPFTLSAKLTRGSDGYLTAQFFKGTTPVGDPRTEESATAGTEYELTHEIASFAAADYGTYKVAAKESADAAAWLDLGSDAIVEVTETPVENPDEDEPYRAELRDLVWDPAFASGTGTIAALVVIFIAALITVAFALTMDKNIGSDDVAAVVVFVGLFLGVLSLTAGAWVIVLEMRGRAPNLVGQTPQAGDPTTAVTKGATSATLESFAKAVSALSKATGAVVLVCVGATIFLASLAYVAWGDDDDGSDDDPTTTTTTVVEVGG